jgi:purine-binding chemotaxis protein CheW
MTDNYIIFSVAGTSYALASQDVAHIEMLDEVTRVPNAPRFVDGVVFSRGEVVPAVNLRVRFGFERAPYDARTRLLVVRPAGRLVGFVVDAAREFMTVPEASIHPPHEGLSGLSGRYIRGIAAIGERMVVVLDLDAILEADDGAVSGAGELAAQHSQESR